MSRYAKSFVVAVLVVQLSALLHDAVAQTNDSLKQSVLVIEQEKSHNQVSITVGMTIAYKTTTSKHFTTSRIEAFTDSTISFKNKTTHLYKDLVVIKIIRKEKKIGGVALVLSGGLVFLAGGTGYIDETLRTVIPSALLIGAGTALLLDHKMYLLKSWVGQTVHYRSSETGHSEKGLITEVTDSTISFQSLKTGHVTVLSKDKAVFKTTRNKVFGLALVIAGVAGIIISPIYGGYGILFIGFPSVAMLVSGVSIMTSRKKVHLEKSWQLKTSMATRP